MSAQPSGCPAYEHCCLNVSYIVLSESDDLVADYHVFLRSPGPSRIRSLPGLHCPVGKFIWIFWTSPPVCLSHLSMSHCRPVSAFFLLVANAPLPPFRHIVPAPVLLHPRLLQAEHRSISRRRLDLSHHTRTMTSIRVPGLLVAILLLLAKSTRTRTAQRLTQHTNIMLPLTPSTHISTNTPRLLQARHRRHGHTRFLLRWRQDRASDRWRQSRSTFAKPVVRASPDRVSSRYVFPALHCHFEPAQADWLLLINRRIRISIPGSAHSSARSVAAISAPRPTSAGTCAAFTRGNAKLCCGLRQAGMLRVLLHTEPWGARARVAQS